MWPNADQKTEYENNASPSEAVPEEDFL